MIFQKGGNAVDAACAMIAATSTMWDTLSWGARRRPRLHPHTGKVVGVNRSAWRRTGPSGVLPIEGDGDPRKYGPLAAVTPGTPGGIMVMLAEWGRLSLADVLARRSRWRRLRRRAAARLDRGASARLAA